MPEVGGSVAPGFESVRDVFTENFKVRNELGAACAVYYHGQCVVDLWGGVQNKKTQTPWHANTHILVFSATKGICALAFALLHSRGQLDYDQTIAHYWPEFAAQGKASITIAQLLRHEAGLFGLSTRITPALLMNKEKLAEVLAAQKPRRLGETAYHAQSLGWYMSEICHRVDPKKRYLGEFVQEEICQPLGLHFYMGLPKDFNEQNLATLYDTSRLELLLTKTPIPKRFIFSLLLPFSMASASLRNPPLTRPAQVQQRPWRYCEMPASNGIGTVKSLAKAYQLLTDVPLPVTLSRDTQDLLRMPPQAKEDRVLRHRLGYHLGFTHPAGDMLYCSNSRAMGFAGLGGSLVFADPDKGLTYAYAANQLAPALWDAPNERLLREEVLQIVA